LALTFLLQWYVVGSWEAWHGTVAFGARFFVNSVPMFVLGLAALFHRLQARVSRPVLVAVSGAFVLWNFLLIVQYVFQWIPRSGPVSLSLLVRNQFTVAPRSLGQVWGFVVARLRR
jgi:hypothetical protein